jgi:hypothetical protein
MTTVNFRLQASSEATFKKSVTLSRVRTQDEEGAFFTFVLSGEGAVGGGGCTTTKAEVLDPIAAATTSVKYSSGLRVALDGLIMAGFSVLFGCL